MQGGLEGENSAQLITDPSRNTRGLADLFHENGTYVIQCLLIGDAVAVACQYRLLQAGAEECR